MQGPPKNILGMNLIFSFETLPPALLAKAKQMVFNFRPLKIVVAPPPEVLMEYDYPYTVMELAEAPSTPTGTTPYLIVPDDSLEMFEKNGDNIFLLREAGYLLQADPQGIFIICTTNNTTTTAMFFYGDHSINFDNAMVEHWLDPVKSS